MYYNLVPSSDNADPLLVFDHTNSCLSLLDSTFCNYNRVCVHKEIAKGPVSSVTGGMKG